MRHDAAGILLEYVSGQGTAPRLSTLAEACAPLT
jgi:hypothetical protein